MKTTDPSLAPAAHPRRAWCVALGCAAYAGCVQMCGFEQGQFTPDASVDVLSNEPDAARHEPEPPVSCETYCEKVIVSCSGDNAVYPDNPPARALAHCLALCPHYGDEGVQCRYSQLNNLETLGDDIRERCSAAGPTGWSPDENARCAPSVCASYCELMRLECPTTRVASSDAGRLASDEEAYLAACLDVCRALPSAPGDSAYRPLRGGADVMGNNVDCRLLHIGNAAADDQAPAGMSSFHCEHAAGRESFCTPGDTMVER